MNSSAGKLWGLVQAKDGTTPEGMAEAIAAAASSPAGAAKPVSHKAEGGSSTSTSAQARVHAGEGGAFMHMCSGRAAVACAGPACPGARARCARRAHVMPSACACPPPPPSPFAAAAFELKPARDEAWAIAPTVLEHKGRAVAKRQLDDMHMSAILKDMAPVPNAAPGPAASPTIASVAGTAMAVAAGAAAVALHQFGFGL